MLNGICTYFLFYVVSQHFLFISKQDFIKNVSNVVEEMIGIVKNPIVLATSAALAAYGIYASVTYDFE